MRKFLVLILIVGSLFTACSRNNMELINLKKYFDEFQVEGCFVLYDLAVDKLKVYNLQRAETRFYPASTFKIFNTLVALETGVAVDENFFLAWDGIEREMLSHNQDHTLKQAFANSTVWFYQEVARRIGEERMQAFIDTTEYGNRDISGGIDKFWLEGPLEITALEQIEFLKKLYLNKLAFSKRSLELTKEIMLKEENDSYTLRGKTGTISLNDRQICWYVGYIERDAKPYFFALNLESPKTANFLEGLALQTREALLQKILSDEFGLI